jgi:hypothetical protein
MNEILFSSYTFLLCIALVRTSQPVQDFIHKLVDSEQLLPGLSPDLGHILGVLRGFLAPCSPEEAPLFVCVCVCVCVCVYN